MAKNTQIQQIKQRPIYVLKGRNYLRYFSSISLVGIIIIDFILFKDVLIPLVLILGISLFGLLNIRFPKAYISTDYLLIEKKGAVDRFSERKLIKFIDIEEAYYSKAYTDWVNIIASALLGSRSSGSRSKAEQLIVKLNDGQKYILNRFGRKKDFIQFIGRIKEKVVELGKD